MMFTNQKRQEAHTLAGNAIKTNQQSITFDESYVELQWMAKC